MERPRPGVVPPRPASTPGPKPTKGPRQAKPVEWLTDEATAWRTCRVGWHGQQTAAVELATGTALWHTDGSVSCDAKSGCARAGAERCPPNGLVHPPIGLCES
jgi:hypothetical protein